MSTAADKQDQLSPRQERKWFGLWILALSATFVAAAGLSVWFEWQAKRQQESRNRQLMDPVAPDPGVTVAIKSSTGAATPVYVGFYVERIPELSIKDATWTVVFDVWFRWRGDDLKPADGFVV